MPSRGVCVVLRVIRSQEGHFKQVTGMTKSISRDYSGRGIKNLFLKHDARDQKVVLIHGLEGHLLALMDYENKGSHVPSLRSFHLTLWVMGSL